MNRTAVARKLVALARELLAVIGEPLDRGKLDNSNGLGIHLSPRSERMLRDAGFEFKSDQPDSDILFNGRKVGHVDSKEGFVFTDKTITYNKRRVFETLGFNYL